MWTDADPVHGHVSVTRAQRVNLRTEIIWITHNDKNTNMHQILCNRSFSSSKPSLADIQIFFWKKKKKKKTINDTWYIRIWYIYIYMFNKQMRTFNSITQNLLMISWLTCCGLVTPYMVSYGIPINSLGWGLRHLLWNCHNCHNVNVTGLKWWKVNIGSDNGLLPSGNKPLPEPMLTQISVAIWCH